MGEHTLISWCDHTFNPWIGCQKIAPACDGCYAARLMDERLHRVEFGGPGKGVGTRARTSAANWKELAKWNRKAAEAGTRPFVFGGSLMDPFDKHVDRGWRRDYFDHIRAAPHLVMLLLTKRPQLIVELSEDAGGLPRNVALGTTAEDEPRWEHNIPELALAKAATNPLFAFVSIEPILSSIYVRKAPITTAMKRHPAWSGRGHEFFDPIHPRQDPRFKIDWIITGGETDQGDHEARPWHPAWLEDIRDDCAATDTPFHHKQNGEWHVLEPVFGQHEAFAIALDGTLYKATDIAYPDGPRYGEALRAGHDRNGRLHSIYRVGKKAAGRLLDGKEHNDRPKVTA
jgi:protein gp37